jgi:hypothetical protein
VDMQLYYAQKRSKFAWVEIMTGESLCVFHAVLVRRRVQQPVVA